jgi:hypothetical protein
MLNSEFRTAGMSSLAGAAGQLAGCSAFNNTAPFGGLCNGGNNNSNKTVAITAPVTTYDKRMNQLDVRFGRILRFGRTRTTLNLDVFNVFNDSTILGRNNAFTKTNGFNAVTGIGINNITNTLWTPTSILQARFYKLTATFDF